ncbi:flagellin [Rhizobium sp. LC145]|uniref:flagellin N-terminal helical domain-containing protein n=1 Tax=Rhizobium sp. LC145 TaxID=1120688 RepID=UPI00062A0A1C|nr:flagellin [Rhizobium sp. LC145]KKX23678.1 flagellin [Rhizobium sp. LC145]TKT58977.1 flagellin [Rhizobiaceae bacterium LC148]
MASILTNAASMAALQTLRTISNDMATTQDRISTGLKVGAASDNAAYWSIATTMRSDNAALSSVQDALGLGAAKVDTAYAGMESAIDVVKEIKNKLITAMEPTADKAKIQEEVTQLQEQLKSIADSASFSGENWLQGKVTLNGAALTDAAEIAATNKQVVGSFTRTSSGVSVSTIDYKLSTSNVLFDSGLTADGTAGAGGLLDKAAKATVLKSSVSNLDITDLSIYKGGTTAAVDADALVAADATDKDALEALLKHVDTQLEAMGSAASELGSISKRISMQEDFASKLSDTMERGIGRLVDADMNEESTKLKALQTQQQLAIQALSIANSDSQNILSLFR